MKIGSDVKRVLIGLLVLGVVYIAINWKYFYQNLNYSLHKPQPQQHVVETPKEEPDKLIIPSLDLNLPVVYVDQISEKVFQEALKSGVVHYPNTAMPGEAGDVYIFGHSSDYVWVKSNYKSAFALLPHMQIGDTIHISDQNGKGYDYVMIDKKIVSPSETSVLQQDKSQHLLTLQTSYPIGTALKRYLVIAKLKE